VEWRGSLVLSLGVQKGHLHYLIFRISQIYVEKGCFLLLKFIKGVCESKVIGSRKNNDA